MTCSRSQRNVHRPGFEPGTPWSEIQHPNRCATPPLRQRRWDVTNSGRVLYSHRNTVGVKNNKLIHQKYPRVVSKLRTGYCLNEYLHKIGVVDTPYCECGEIEHYIIECSETQDLRERLRLKLWQQTGMDLWSMEIFLSVTNKDKYLYYHNQERYIINDIFEEFLERSGRLIKTR